MSSWRGEMSGWDVGYVMDFLDLYWLKTSINHNVAADDARAKRHERAVICNTDAVTDEGQTCAEAADVL